MHYNKNSESINNISKAFEHEAVGHVRYMILTDNAEGNGDHALASIYKQLANEEYAHARNWYKQLHGGEVEEYALENSIKAEERQYKYTYPQMAAKAELEGYEMLADMFSATANVEGDHGRMLKQFSESTNQKPLNEDAVWRCSVCGNTFVGIEPPNQCPLCGYNKTSYAMLKH